MVEMVEMQVVGWRRGKPLQQASIPKFLSPLPVPARVTFEEEVLLLEAIFWRTRCCCPSAKPSSAKSLAGSAWSSSDKTHRLALGERSRLLTVPFSLPSHFWPHWGSSSPSWLVRTRPASMLTLTPACTPGMQRVRQVLEGQPPAVADGAPPRQIQGATKPHR